MLTACCPSQYVELPEMAAERAVQTLNHRNMGTRYVEVFRSGEGEMILANGAPPAPTRTCGPGWAMGMGDAGSNVRLRPARRTPHVARRTSHAARRTPRMAGPKLQAHWP